MKPKQRATIGIRGAGPHGHELAALFAPATLLDDHLIGYQPCSSWRGPYLIGAAWPAVRRQIYREHGLSGEPWQDGTVLFPGAQVSPHTKLGHHTHVGYNAVVSHGCQVGSFVQICSGVVLGGEVTVEDEVFIGVNASVIHGGITIGRGAVIGAGAVVTRDVLPGTTVMGVPARQHHARIAAAWR